MNRLILDVLEEIKRNVFLLILAGVLLLGPVVLYANLFESSNVGLVPFLLSPAFLAIFGPQLSEWKRGVGSRIIVRCLLFPILATLIFLICYLLFGTPRPVSCLQGMLFLASFSILLNGLTLLARGAGASPFVSIWCSTVIGLMVVSSFVYLSPAADHFYNRPNLRNTIITIATRSNPILAMSGGILEQDLLRGAYLYEHLSIGRYYSYSAPSWVRLGLTYTVIGVLSGIMGLVIEREETVH